MLPTEGAKPQMCLTSLGRGCFPDLGVPHPSLRDTERGHTGSMPIVRDEKSQLAHVSQDLLQAYSQLPPETVRREVTSATSAFTEARVRTFVPLLVQKRVRDQLRPLLRAHAAG